MRYAIFSDIHGNLPAWEAVLKDMKALEVDVFVCLGDVVGYGPKPQEVLDAIREVTTNFVIGNHDAAAAGMMDTSIFNQQARDAIVWTKQHLSDEAIEFLRGTPLAIGDEKLLFVHAELEMPGRFKYIETVDEARANFKAVPGKITFIGHTHHPCVFVRSPRGAVRQLQDDNRILDRENRYIVNVGSVGEPRNPNDIRARYVIYDDDTRSLAFRKIEFDVEAYREHLRGSGLNVTPYFLRVVDQYQEALAQAQATPGTHAMMADMQTASLQPIAPAAPRRQLVVPTLHQAVNRPKPSVLAAPAPRTGSGGNVIAISLTVGLVVVLGLLIWSGAAKRGNERLALEDSAGGSKAGVEAMSLAGAAETESSELMGFVEPASEAVADPEPDPEADPPVEEDVAEVVGAAPALEAPKQQAPAEEAVAPLPTPAHVVSHWRMDDPGSAKVFEDSVGAFALGSYQDWTPSSPIAADPLPLTRQVNLGAVQVRLAGEQPDGAGTFALKKEQGFTYEGWFHAGGEKEVTLGNTQTGTGAGWRVALLRGDGESGFAAFMYQNGGKKVQALGRDLAIFDDRAHHFAAVWDPEAEADAGRLSIFIDNEAVGTAMLPHADVEGESTNPLQIGGDPGPFTIDELRFSSAALGAAQFLTAGRRIERQDAVLFEFEGDDWAGWTVEGNAFGTRPASGRVTAAKAFSGRFGDRIAHSSHGGDGAKGTIRSPSFKITHRYLRFLIGGGPHATETFAGLVVDGELVRSTPGMENLDLRDVLWDVSEFANREAKFVVVDAHGGRWGVVAVDQVVLTDEAGGLEPAP